MSWIWRLSVKLLGFRCDVIRLQHVLCRKSRKWGLRGGCRRMFVPKRPHNSLALLCTYVLVIFPWIFRSRQRDVWIFFVSRCPHQTMYTFLKAVNPDISRDSPLTAARWHMSTYCRSQRMTNPHRETWFSWLAAAAVQVFKKNKYYYYFFFFPLKL